MIKTIQNKKGFTLLELLIFLALFSVLMMVMTNLFTAIVETQVDTQAVSSVESDSKYITSRMIYDIQRAQSIIVPASLGQSSSSLSLIIDGDLYVYNVTNGMMQLTTGGTTDALSSATTTVRSLTFRRLGNIGGKNAVRVQLEIESTQRQASGPETKIIDTVIGLR